MFKVSRRIGVSLKVTSGNDFWVPAPEVDTRPTPMYLPIKKLQAAIFHEKPQEDSTIFFKTDTFPLYLGVFLGIDNTSFQLWIIDPSENDHLERWMSQTLDPLHDYLEEKRSKKLKKARVEDWDSRVPIEGTKKCIVCQMQFTDDADFATCRVHRESEPL